MILDIAESLAACLDRESARRIARFHLDDSVLTRLQELIAKDRRGELTTDERMELIHLYSIEEFIALLQRKARAVLRRPSAPRST